MHSHIDCLDRIILKTADNRCAAYADAVGLASEDVCVRLYPRNIMIFKDRVGCTNSLIKTCRHPFVEHCKDALQMGIFLSLIFMLL